MGLDAAVLCCCHAQGRTTPPPYAEHVIIDSEGYPALDLPWEGHEAEHDAFDAWMGSACEHPNMDAANERISNWGGYRLFQEALRSVGREHLPTLKSVLPNANEGRVAPHDAARCLEELDEFERRYATDVSALVDSATDEVLHHHIRTYGGVFMWAGGAGVDVGVDDSGLFVRRRGAANDEIFRAVDIQQTLIDIDGVPGAELVDRERGTRVVVRVRIDGRAIPWPDGRMQDDRGRWNFAHPERMHVARRRRDAASFAYILEPLRTVLRASVATGNPVRWC